MWFLSLFILICLSCLSSECQHYGVLPATLPLCTLGSSSKTNGSGAQSPLLPWHLPSPLQHPLLQWGPPWFWQPSTALPPHTWVVTQVQPFKLRGTITIKNLKFYICIHTHTHNGILLSHKKWNTAIFRNMDGPRDDQIQWSQSEGERQISYNITYGESKIWHK